MGGRHYNLKMARWAAGGFPQAIAAELRAVARTAVPCTCPHPAKDHEDDSGCLNGWGKPPATGCMCAGVPTENTQP